MSLKAVLFDYDGTLRNSKAQISDSLKHVFEAHNLSVPSDEDLAPHIHHHSYVHEALASDELSFEDFENTYRSKIDNDIQGARLYDGAVDVLKALQSRGYKLGLVTAARLANENLIRHQIRDYFDVVVSADEITKHKPDPEGINIAVQRLGIQPSEAIYIGDMMTDIYAAQAANLKATIGVTLGFANRRELETANADYVIDSLAELLAVVEQLDN